MTKRLINMCDGEIFNTITYGKNLMGAYGANVTVEDRWAIIAYVRALQRSQLATADEVPEPDRAPIQEIDYEFELTTPLSVPELDSVQVAQCARDPDRHRRHRRDGGRALRWAAPNNLAFPGCWPSCFL